MTKRYGDEYGFPARRELERYFRSILTRDVDADYLDFLVETNGGVPSKKKFLVNAEEGDSELSLFSCFADRATPGRSLKYKVEWPLSDLVEGGLLPIAGDVCGNQICLAFRLPGQPVMFFDHETEAIHRLADNFREFCNSLT